MLREAGTCSQIRTFIDLVDRGKIGTKQPKVRGSPQGGMPSPALRGRMQQAIPSAAPPHHQALERLAQGARLSTIEDMLASYRERSRRIRELGDRKQAEEFFDESRRFLMAPEKWTYGNMLAYQRKVLDKMGAFSWRRRLQADDPSIQHLEKELKVLEAMTPVELASNHKSVFTREAIKLIAEKASATDRFVNSVIMQHDILRADRRWYMILEQFGKTLPRDFEDRQYMAEYDRPFSETETEMREDMMAEAGERMGKKRPPSTKCIYFRHPTCGGNRWSTRPPRWYPHCFRMRPERLNRLRGTSAAGGRGGDRGRPWGRMRGLGAAGR